MKKRFNVTGVCFPEQHYMADTTAKYARIWEMIEQGDYFTINRPRQYGKTTALFQFAAQLNVNHDYLALRISFEGLGDAAFESETALSSVFLKNIAAYCQRVNPTLAEWIEAQIPGIGNLSELSDCITQLVKKAGKKVVLLIDEIDKSSNNQLFLSLLGVLRNKFLERWEVPTFHSVILTGVHDVKNLKLKLRPDEERKYNSPWNIAADFEVDMNFSALEIRPMLEDFAQDSQIQIEIAEVAERIFFYTSGYPFLVSKLCKIVAEKILPTQSTKHWSAQEVDQAAHLLVRESNNVNIDELIKNIRNNPELYQLIERMLIEGADFSFAPHADAINLGLVYGIFAKENQRLAIQNRIYREVIFNYLSANAEHQSPIAGRDSADAYVLPGQRFNVQKALLKFQELMKSEYSKKDRNFLERQGRLVFLAFLKPILNGHGHAFKEPQTSEEKRLDILITYYQHQYVIELKLWRGPQAHENGLNQLSDYLDRLGLQEGALLVFDHQGQNNWKSELINWKGKAVFVVWV
jgi:hypothetical protein